MKEVEAIVESESGVTAQFIIFYNITAITM